MSLIKKTISMVLVAAILPVPAVLFSLLFIGGGHLITRITPALSVFQACLIVTATALIATLNHGFSEVSRAIRLTDLRGEEDEYWDDDENEEELDLLEAEAEEGLFRDQQPVGLTRPGNMVGRNHPCPCKSGKKYKLCCLNKDLQEDDVIHF